MGRWQRYWFTHGGRTAAAVVRVALAASMLLTLWQLGGGEPAARSVSYRPLGPWLLLGVPPADVIDGLRIAAWSFTVLMLLGLWSRATTALSLACSIALAASHIGLTGSWAHHDSAPFLAQLAFLGARGGDTLSLDAWWRSRRGIPPLSVGDGYLWSVWLVQIAVASIFATAAWAGMFDGESLRPALADGLRRELERHAAGGPSPAAAWLLADPRRLEIGGIVHLVAALLPLGAVLAVNRPLLRVAFGAVFVLEIVAHGVVLGAWSLAWLPLAAVFVDWDQLLDWTAERVVRRKRAMSPPLVPYHHRVARVFIVVFLGLEIALCLVLYPRVDPAHRDGGPTSAVPAPAAPAGPAAAGNAPANSR